MATEKGLYAKVVMIRRKDYDNKNEKKKTKKYNFQGKSTRSIRWFDLDHEWLEKYLRTRETDFYENFIKQILGVMIRKHINYLYYQLIMQKL